MNKIKHIAAGILLLSFFNNMKAQDTTITRTDTTIIKGDTAIVKTQSSRIIDRPANAPAPVRAPLPPDDEKYVSTDYPQAGFHLGVRFQPTFSSFKTRTSDNNEVEGDFTAGFGYGAFISYYFSNYAGTQLEVMYSSIAQKYQDAGSERKIGLSYINIPLLLTLNTNYGKPINFNVAIGPQIGINTGSTLDGSSSEETFSGQAVLAVKPADLGIAYGAGFDVGLGSKRHVHLNLGFRGVYGFIDIGDNSQTKSTNQYLVLDRTHVETYAAYIGFTFKL